MNTDTLRIFEETIATFPVVTLSNGLVVVNFNSPHSFEFEDGTILPAVSDKIAEETKLDSEDIEYDNGRFIDVTKRYIMSNACLRRLLYATHIKCDVVIVPLPVLQSLKDTDFPTRNCRTIFFTDRIKKTVSINKFCI